MRRLLLFALSLLPAIGYAMYISPVLWSHNSSAAFEMWLFLWGLVLVLPILALCVDLKPNR